MITDRKKPILIVLTMFSLLVFLAPGGALAGNVLSCADLMTARLRPSEDAQSLTIDSATLVAGTPDLPEHCYVQGHLDTEINFELKLPTTWNGKVQMRGNGAFAGYLPYLDDIVAGQYAAVGTDTGHNGGPEELLNHPDRIVNFQYRAVHLVALTARQIAKAYYHAAPRHAYFVGYSNGGRQAMMEVQKYPDDFDGVDAGAPNSPSGGFPNGGSQLWNMRVLFPGGPDTAVLPTPKVALLSQLVLKKCDGLDGVVDGIVDNPPACNFSPQNDLPRCANDVDGPDCFTRAQIKALTLIHQGPFSQGKRLGPRFYFSGVEGFMPWGPDAYGIGEPALDFAEMESGYPGYLFPPDWQLQWQDAWGTGMPSFAYWVQTNYLRNIVFSDRNYLLENFDFNKSSDVKTYFKALQPQFPSSPDLSAFARKGGKLIVYHGWGDSLINPMLTVQFYEDGVKAMGGMDQMKSFSRLFMVPGMTHIDGSPNNIGFDEFTALDNWVEGGKAPNFLMGNYYDPTTWEIKATRPICAYPKVARLKNPSFDPTLASSFVCVDMGDNQQEAQQ